MADLAQQLLQAVEKGAADLGEPARLALLQASVKLVETLENPVERLLRLCFVGQLAVLTKRMCEANLSSRPSTIPSPSASPSTSSSLTSLSSMADL